MVVVLPGAVRSQQAVDASRARIARSTPSSARVSPNVLTQVAGLDRVGHAVRAASVACPPPRSSARECAAAPEVTAFPSAGNLPATLCGPICADEKHRSRSRPLAAVASVGLSAATRNRRPRRARGGGGTRAGARARAEAAAAHRLQRLAGLDRVRDRDPEGLVQGGRRRRQVRLVRVRAVDGGVRRRQGRRRHDDDGRRAGDRRAGRAQRRPSWSPTTATATT